MHQTLKRRKNLSKRDKIDVDCNRRKSCPTECYPACSSSQICVNPAVTGCEEACPVNYCIAKTQPQSLLSVTNFVSNSSSNTALIAGLTTGLVVAALIIVTVGGFVFYRKRKWKKILELQQEEEKRAYIPPQPPRIVPDIQSVLPPPAVIIASSINSSSNSIPPLLPDHWNQQTMKLVENDHPQSPFIVGAHSLQIPHLNTTIPDPSSAIMMRRSLYIPATTTRLDTSFFVNRSLSVKVGKFDNRQYPTSSDEEEPIKIRRAVSVKKNNSTTSHSSSITRVGSHHDDVDSIKKVVYYAQPKMARISTVTSLNENGTVTRKRSIRTISTTNQEVQQSPKPFNISLTDDPPLPSSTSNIDIYFCPPSEISSIKTSSNNSSTCTLADGEITVFLEPTTTATN